jgi:hypothetical protein
LYGSALFLFWREERSEIASQLKEIAIAFKNQGPVDANELYEAVMSTKGFAEEMLASAFDYMVQWLCIYELCLVF